MTVPRFAEHTRRQLRDLAPTATVVVPTGSTEQHGPHLPVSTDTTIVSAMAERAVEEAAESVPVLLAPTLPFGFSDYHLAFGATISIGVAVYLDVLSDIGKSLVADGFRRIVFLNGHGGNESAISQVGARLVSELGLDVHVASTSYWDVAADALAGLDLDVGPVPGHAGGFETSCVLALRPDLVDLEHAPPPEATPQPLADSGMAGATVIRPGVWEASDGRTDDSARANSEAGERVLAAVAQQIARFIVAFHRSTE